jgi:hypothetical protein
VAGGLGSELRLYNFAIGQDKLKPEHEQAIAEFIKRFDLADPCQEQWVVASVVGFTDPIDNESENATLRMLRGFAASDYLHAHGVPDAPDGVGNGPSTVCTPDERTFDRAAVIRLKRLPKPAVPKCKDEPPPKPPDEKPGPPRGVCNLPSSRDWQITGRGSAQPPVDPGASVVVMLFTIEQLDDKKNVVARRPITFKGVGPGASAGLPLTIALPSPTVFRTDKFVYFEDFEGAGIVRDGGGALGAGYSLMKGVVAPRTQPLELDLSGWQLGFTVGAEVVAGAWSYDGAARFICLKP